MKETGSGNNKIYYTFTIHIPALQYIHSKLKPLIATVHYTSSLFRLILYHQMLSAVVLSQSKSRQTKCPIWRVMVQGTGS